MFNINEFKTVMNKYGGPAKSNLFVLKINFPNETNSPSTASGIPGVNPGVRYTEKNQYITSSDLRFFCSEVAIPSLNINVASYRENSIDLSQSMPINLNGPSINATFMLDSDHRVIAFFHSWMQEIINYNARNGLLSSLNGDHYPYEIGYKSDYSCIIEITHYKTDSSGAPEEGYTYTFLNAFPTEIGGKNFSWTPNDSIGTVSINFSASSFFFTGSKAGSTISPISRGNGYLDFLNSVGFRGQTFQQTNLPISVQDAINTFTTVRNDFRTIRNTFNSFRNTF
jgi:hypothetical protein